MSKMMRFVANEKVCVQGLRLMYKFLSDFSFLVVILIVHY